MFGFLCSKKGFTVVELATVVIVMGILTAIAVPLFGAGIKEQKQNDCRNQAIVVQTAVQQAMYGMLDNGKKQETIPIGKWADGGAKVKKQHTPGDGLNVDEALNYKYYTYLDKELTLGDIRGGYRDTTVYPEYRDGCGNGNFLKKKALEETKFYTYLSNQEFPICPFDNEKNPQYKYVIFEDGSVFCNCPDCNETD